MGAHQVTQAIRAHIHLEWRGFFFYRKLGADAARANIALHGFSVSVMNSVLLWIRSRLF
jgi:hypothetical protein